MDSSWNRARTCERNQADKVIVTGFHSRIHNDAEVCKVPVAAASECSTHTYDVASTPAACVVSLWTQCREVTIGRARGFSAFRSHFSANRSQQGDGNYRCRFSVSTHTAQLSLTKSVEPMLNNPSLHSADQPRRAIQNALALIQSGKVPSLNVTACLVETSATDFLQTLWLELNLSVKSGMTVDAVKPLAVFILATPRGTLSPPLLPIFLHNVLPSLIDRPDNPMTGDLELLIAIASSSLMAALQLERALYTTGGEQAYPLGSSSSSMARRLAVDLRYRKNSPKGKLMAQRLTSSQTFVTNFPVFKTEI